MSATGYYISFQFTPGDLDTPSLVDLLSVIPSDQLKAWIDFFISIEAYEKAALVKREIDRRHTL